MDLFHFWGNDLSLSATGDLLAVDGADRGEQRVIRRLCTNGESAIDQLYGEVLHHQAYGAGLPRYIGQPAAPITIEGIAREQMLKEEAVMQTPEPQISSRQDGIGTLTIGLRYYDRPTQSPRTLSFDLSE